MYSKHLVVCQQSYVSLETDLFETFGCLSAELCAHGNRLVPNIWLFASRVMCPWKQTYSKHLVVSWQSYVSLEADLLPTFDYL